MLIVCRTVSKKHTSTYWMQSTRSYATPTKQKFLIQNCTLTNNNIRKIALAEEIIVANTLRSIIGPILQKVRDLNENIDSVRVKTKSEISVIPELKQILAKNGTFKEKNLRKIVPTKDVKSKNTPKSAGASILDISRANHNDSIQVKTKSESSANPESKQVLDKVGTVKNKTLKEIVPPNDVKIINTLSVAAPILIHHISHSLGNIWRRTKSENSVTPEKKQILDKDGIVKDKTGKEIVLPKDVQVTNTLSIVAPILFHHITHTLSNIWIKAKCESSVTPEKTQILDKTCSSVDKNLETAKEINNTNTLTSTLGYILVPNLHHIVGSIWASTQWKSCVTPDLKDMLIICSTLVDYNLLKGVTNNINYAMSSVFKVIPNLNYNKDFEKILFSFLQLASINIIVSGYNYLPDKNQIWNISENMLMKTNKTFDMIKSFGSNSYTFISSQVTNLRERFSNYYNSLSEEEKHRLIRMVSLRIAHFCLVAGAAYFGYPLTDEAQLTIRTLINFFTSGLSADQILTTSLEFAEPYLPSSVRRLNIVEWIDCIRLTTDACNYAMSYCMKN